MHFCQHGRVGRVSFMFLCSFPLFIYLFIFRLSFLREPVLWLVANDRMEEAERVLKLASRWNRKDPRIILKLFRGLAPSPAGPAAASDKEVKHTPSLLHVDEEEETTAFVGEQELGDVPSKEERRQSEGVNAKLGFLDLLRHRLLRRNALVSWFIW